MRNVKHWMLTQHVPFFATNTCVRRAIVLNWKERHFHLCRNRKTRIENEGNSRIDKFKKGFCSHKIQTKWCEIWVILFFCFQTLTNVFLLQFRVQILLSLGAPHVDSFNYMLDEGLADCAKNIHPVEFEVPSGDRIKLFVESITITQPQVPNTCISARNKKIYPTECRQRAITYTGACTVGVGWAINGVTRPTVDKSMGEIPVMIRVCSLDFVSSRILDNFHSLFFL